ncbi:hypothetical protein [Wohlfahrtiimonas larvae]|uniref:VCBS repeat-containing protein n=1 Tax=Wohlfahrtiimonas larvae TaxID=1157986 RepID=A0ABP9MWW6_9GAMM|nr:hypothetical protein [Wohlfahrtiimonas larvae]
MKKLYLIGLISCLLTSLSFADSKDQFMLGDYRIIDVMQSDLNNDGLDDLVLLVKDTKPDGFQPDQWGNEIVDKNRRGLVVFLKTEGGYQKVLEHKTIFSSENENGGVYFPPDLMVSLKKDILNIYYAHGRYGAWSYTFRYDQKGDFDLIGYDSQTNRGPITLSTTSINFLTDKKKILTNPDEGNEDWDIKDFKETWERLPKAKIIKLSEIKDIDELDIH